MKLNNSRLEERLTVIRKEAEALVTPIKDRECLHHFQKGKQLFWEDNRETKEAKMGRALPADSQSLRPTEYEGRKTCHTM